MTGGKRKVCLCSFLCFELHSWNGRFGELEHVERARRGLVMRMSADQCDVIDEPESYFLGSHCVVTAWRREEALLTKACGKREIEGGCQGKCLYMSASHGCNSASSLLLFQNEEYSCSVH